MKTSLNFKGKIPKKLENAAGTALNIVHEFQWMMYLREDYPFTTQLPLPISQWLRNDRFGKSFFVTLKYAERVTFNIFYKKVGDPEINIQKLALKVGVQSTGTRTSREEFFFIDEDEEIRIVNQDV